MNDWSKIPASLRASPRWVLWRYELRGGKRTKVPFDPVTARPGDATDPNLWLSFEAALAASPPASQGGIGFQVDGSGYVGVDLDGCLDESGQLADWALDVVCRLESYTEVTPSGRGLRVWCQGSLPPGRRRKGPVELYDSGRYFTVTGHQLDATPAEIAERTAELAALHAELFPPKPRAPARRAAGPVNLSDREILDRAFRSKHGSEIEALFRGDTSRYPSGSEADLALCSHLAFFAGGDALAVDRLFRASGLCDAKWTDRADYRERTVQKALEQTSFYDPYYGRNGHPGGNGAGNGNGVPPPRAGPRPGAEEPPRGPDEAIDDPHRLARLFLADRYTRLDGLTLRYWTEEWHRWDGQCWRVTPDREIHAALTGAIKAEFDRFAAATGAKVRSVTTGLVANVAQALRDLTHLPTWECPRQPAWIGEREPGEDLPAPVEVLPASNALLHLPSLVAGELCHLPPTPRFFSPNTLGYAFDPDAPAPASWLAFLESLWGDDRESIGTLQEWFGYLLTPDTGQQKILLLIGPKRSGKGTIGRVLRALVGPVNVAAPTLSGLATNFGLAPLIGKTVALIADARLSNRADAQVIVERLLSISGEDAQTIDRKHLSSWTGSLPTRFVLVSNELPRLGDASGALPSRMILLRLTRSFYGEEDAALTGRLLRELPGILLWAIEGWRRLRERGRFVQTESGRDLIDDLDELSSPVATFVAERCEVGPDCRAPIKDLFGAWKTWCAERGRDHVGDEQGFGRNLRATLPSLRVKRTGSDGCRTREYEGVALRKDF